MLSRRTSGPTVSVLAELRVGSATITSLGHDAEFGLVVVQRLSDSRDRRGRRRLLGRARRAARLAHPSLLVPLRIDADRANTAVVWPWLPGRDLASLVDRHGPLDDAWASEMEVSLGAAVHALHRAGVVHGALSATHVLLDGDGQPVLIGLDPAMRASPAAVAADRRALAEICSNVLERPGASDAPNPAGRAPFESRPTDLRLGPIQRSGRERLRLPLAAGLAVALLGTLAAGRGRNESACRDPGSMSELAADVDGDGCLDHLVWSTESATLRAMLDGGERAWTLGRPGDRLLLGDWDCNNSITPGIYRPGTGSTFTFDRWPMTGPVRATSGDRVSPCRASADPAADE